MQAQGSVRIAEERPAAHAAVRREVAAGPLAIQLQAVVHKVIGNLRLLGTVGRAVDAESDLARRTGGELGNYFQSRASDARQRVRPIAIEVERGERVAPAAQRRQLRGRRRPQPARSIEIEHAR